MAETIQRQVAATADDAYLRVGTDAFDNSAPTLVIDYNGRDYHNWVRFTGITIPSGATITVAYLQLSARSTITGNDSSVRIYGLDVDNVGDFSDRDTTKAYALTTEFTDWTVTDWSAGTWYNTDSLVDEVQEIVDLMGGLSNEAMGFRLNNAAQAVLRQADTWDRAGNVQGAKLYIEYTTYQPRPSGMASGTTQIY